MSCVVIVCNARRSLFYYQPDESWDTFYDPFFVPSFEPTFTNPDLEEEAMEVCDDDINCLYDIATTGKVQIGVATRDTSVQIEQILRNTMPGKSITRYWILMHFQTL